MGWFDDEDEDAASTISADPEAVASAWDVVSSTIDEYVEEAEQTVQTVGGYASGAAEVAVGYATNAASTAENYAAAAQETAQEAAQEYVAAAQATVQQTVQDTVQYAAAVEEVVEETVEESVAPYVTAAEPYVDMAVEEAQRQAGLAATAATEFATKAAADFEKDPVGFVAEMTGAPKIEIDLDDADGKMTLKYDGVLADFDGTWEAGKGTTVNSKVGADFGPAPLFEGKLVADADGNLTELNVHAKATVPIESLEVTGETQFGFKDTPDGFKVNYENNIGTEVDGIDLSIGTHGSYEDLGEHGSKSTFGPQGSATVGFGEIVPDVDAAELEAKTSIDFSFSNVDGQTTTGVKNTSTVEASALGQTILSGTVEQGVGYTEGPQGEQIILDQKFSGTAGTDWTGKLTGSSGATYAIGTDAAGNDVDRLTIVNEASAALPGQAPVTYSSTTVQNDATGLPQWIDEQLETAEVSSGTPTPGGSGIAAPVHEGMVDDIMRNGGLSGAVAGMAGVAESAGSGGSAGMVDDIMRNGGLSGAVAGMAGVAESAGSGGSAGMVGDIMRNGGMSDELERLLPSDADPQAMSPGVGPSGGYVRELPLDALNPDGDPDPQPALRPDEPQDTIAPAENPMDDNGPAGMFRPAPTPRDDAPMILTNPDPEPDPAPMQPADVDLDLTRPTWQPEVTEVDLTPAATSPAVDDGPVLTQPEYTPEVSAPLQFEHQDPVYEQQQEPVFEQQQPMFEQQQPTFEQQQPVYEQRQEPVFEQQQQEAVFEQQQPVYEQQQEPVFEQQAPVFEEVYEAPPAFESVISSIDSNASAFEELADFGDDFGDQSSGSSGSASDAGAEQDWVEPG